MDLILILDQGSQKSQIDEEEEFTKDCSVIALLL